MSFKYQQQAFNNEPFPAGMTSQEFFVYIPLRALYQQFKAGQITKEQASDEKAMIEEYAKQVANEDKVLQILGQFLPMIGNGDKIKFWSDLVDTTSQFEDGESEVYRKMIELVEAIERSKK